MVLFSWLSFSHTVAVGCRLRAIIILILPQYGYLFGALYLGWCQLHMSFYQRKPTKQLPRVLSVVLLIMLTLPQGVLAYSPSTGAGDTLDLTHLEQEYIARNPALRVAMLRGVAPLMYVDQNDEVHGIGKLVLDEIAAITGLHFELQAFDTVQETIEGEGIDIILGAEAAYSANTPGLVLSEPFLTSNTILFLHKSIDPSDLTGKTRVIVKGNKLTAEVSEELIVSVNNREEALAAVNTGNADYGYGNVYSVIFYTLQNRYKNLITIPREHDKREYCLGLLQQDDLLLSIINKAIVGIDADKMQAFILTATTDINQELTFDMFVEVYGDYVFTAMLVIIVLLLLWLRSHLRSRATLKMQNQRYEILARLSNEFLFEYNPATNDFTLFEHGHDFFDEDCVDIISDTIKATLTHAVSRPKLGTACENISTVSCEKGTYKLITSNVYTNDGQVQAIIGKLLDVSQEMAEKEALIARAQRDGLTGLLNAMTVRELVEGRLEQKTPGTLDAFLLLDADSFKEVNDKLGHYAGDQVLKTLAKTIGHNFCATDIIGRHGGDEFCVYMVKVPSRDFVENKCLQLIHATRYTVEGIAISVCVGATMITGRPSYEEIFQVADDALYQAKDKGSAQAVVVYNRNK